MWIITTKGFISLVQDRNDPSMLQVRARIREDIERHFPGVRTYAHNGADYRYRAVVSKERVAMMLADEVLNNLTYTSHFKDVAIAMDAKHNASRHSAYYGCWSALARMQDYAPYSRISRADAAKLPPAPVKRWDTGRDVHYGSGMRYTGKAVDGSYSWPGYGDQFYTRPVPGSRVDAREAAREPEPWERERLVDIDSPDEGEVEGFTQDEIDGVRDAFGVEPVTLDPEVLSDMVDQLYAQRYFENTVLPYTPPVDDEEEEEDEDDLRQSRSVQRSKGKRARRRRSRGSNRR